MRYNDFPAVTIAVLCKNRIFETLQTQCKAKKESFENV